MIAPRPLTDAHPVVTARVVLRIVLIVVLVVLALYLIYVLRRPLTWIFIAGFLAIALSGPVNFLARRMKRGLAIALVYFVLILLPVLIGAILVPPVVEQLNNLIQNLPAYAADLQDFVSDNERLRELEEDYNITAELQKQAATLPGRVGDAAGILSDIGLGLVNSIFAAVTIIVLSLFIIGSGRSWLDWLAARQGPEREAWLNRLFDRIGNAVGNYVAGALGQALVAGVLAYIVLLILGVPYAGSLAVIIFLLDLVPLVGATLGAILVLTSVLFGSTLFGVLGALLAIPVAAGIQIAIIEYNAFQRPESIGAVQAPPGEDEPPPPPPPPEPAPA